MPDADRATARQEEAPVPGGARRALVFGLVRAFIGPAAWIVHALERLHWPWLDPLLRLIHHRGFWRFVRFLAVGSLNFALYYSMFTALHLLRLSPTAAVVVATVIAVLFNFWTTGRVVFGNGRMALLPRFVGVYVVQCLLNIAALRALIAAGMPVLIAEALVIGGLAVLTYVALQRFVFGQRPAPGPARGVNGWRAPS